MQRLMPSGVIAFPVYLATMAAIIDIATPKPTLLPTSVNLLILLGGCFTITIVAVVEGRRAHQRYGITFRSGA